MCDDPPHGDLRIPEDGNDDPDFVFESDDGPRIGVEVRKLIKGDEGDDGSHLLKRDGIRRAILKCAFVQFRDGNAEPVDLHVHWVESSNFPPVPQTGEKLADFVAQHVPPVGEYIYADAAELLFEGLSRYISTMRIWHLPEELDQIPWLQGSHLGTVAFWQGVNVETVQAAILDKQSNLEKSYVQSCDEVWLLLHVPLGLSEAYAVGDLAKCVGSAKFEGSGFDRVYVLSEDGPQLVRLTLDE
ncbi:MAG: hypothetical protein ACQEVA_01210 [Myxococcota bacterium]